MTTEAVTRKLKCLMKIYGELYYQERVAKELTSLPMKKYEPRPNVEVPPKPVRVNQTVTWIVLLMLSSIVIYQIFVLGTLWCFVTAFIGIVYISMVMGIENSFEKEKRERDIALEENKKIQATNERLKREWETAKRMQRPIIDEVIHEYNKEQTKTEKIAMNACDSLKLPQSYRNYADVCTLYWYFYSNRCDNMDMAYIRLDKEKMADCYFMDAEWARKNIEKVRSNQPIWAQDLLEREKVVSDCVQKLQERVYWTASREGLNAISDDALNYEIMKRARNLCSMDALGVYSLASSQVKVWGASSQI